MGRSSDLNLFSSHPKQDTHSSRYRSMYQPSSHLLFAAFPLSFYTERIGTISNISFQPTEAELSDVAQEMARRLSEAVQRILKDVVGRISSLTLLFSGGVDSLLLAHLLHTSIELDVIIDLVNVSFDDKSHVSILSTMICCSLITSIDINVRFIVQTIINACGRNSSGINHFCYTPILSTIVRQCTAGWGFPAIER